MTQHIVIVGAGQAGLQACETLRTEGYTGNITMFGDEPYLPYHRPPLSKGWLLGALEAGQLAMRAAPVFERKKIVVRTGVKIAAIDTAAHKVVLENGESVDYTKLLLATGAAPRTISCAPSAQSLVRVLRSRDDANVLAEQLKKCKARGLRLVVVGGGFIGLEVAATARKLGVEVTILEAGARLLERALAQNLSDWFAQLHVAHGAELVLNARIETIDSLEEDVVEVRLADGRRFSAGLVLVGIGVTPNVSLAEAAGIECAGGIVVDAHGRTSAPDVTAAGDCTIRRLDDGRLLRLESVQNAVEQGRAAAATLLGLSRPFTSTPWFWSDQHDKKLQIAGLSNGADEWSLRGDIKGESFSIFHFQDARLIAVDSINASADHLVARKLLGSGVSPTHAQVADSAFDLSTLVTS
ncbi:MAG TPA: FAD-dependent oxidoreductase [Ramlibacter sp.]|nr:FAD-dependent oxidoreductase [Ramlibacter sp.]